LAIFAGTRPKLNTTKSSASASSPPPLACSAIELKRGERRPPLSSSRFTGVASDGKAPKLSASS
jgi:hypothetical protein